MYYFSISKTFKSIEWMNLFIHSFIHLYHQQSKTGSCAKLMLCRVYLFEMRVHKQFNTIHTLDEFIVF